MERAQVKPQPGDLVLYSISFGAKAAISRTLGKKGVLSDVMDALLADNHVRRGFSDRVLAEAAQAATMETRRDAYRADLRDLFTFTVDPAVAHDFDDALSFDTINGNTVAYVHIADVSYYVNEETALDREALRRGNSVYVTTGVEPMLPPVLSSGVCSLQPGVDRKAVTVEMELDAGGRVLATRFYRSLVRSSRRLNYEELEGMFRGDLSSPGSLGEALEKGRPLARRLRENRLGRGGLNINSTEPDFDWDDEGAVVDARPAQELESHFFIEEFMVLANEQVAGFLEKERVPAVYRVHDLPNPFRLEHLLEVLASLDLPTPVFDPMLATSPEIRRVTRETSEYVDRFLPRGKGRAALMHQVLRAQAKAVYQTSNIGHFGLASPAYCHFTSPIRRYPDMLVHRGLLAQLGLGPAPVTSTLSDWAEHCTRTEQVANKIELTADDIALAHLLRRRLPEWGGRAAVFEGQVMSVTRRGLFVLFEKLFEGFLPARELPRDQYELNELETALVGRRRHRAYRLADLIPVRVTDVDEPRGRILLASPEDEP